MRKIFRLAAIAALFTTGGCVTTESYSWLPDDVPEDEFFEAMTYMQENLHAVENTRVVTLVDYSKHSTEDRLFVVDLKDRQVARMRVAHGRGSDEDNDGYLNEFGHVEGSKMSPDGFFVVGERYVGAHGDSLKMDGLTDQNKNARERRIVIHGARYMAPERKKPGRSWGCPAVSQGDMVYLNAALPGSLFYIFGEGPPPERTFARGRRGYASSLVP